MAPEERLEAEVADRRPAGALSVVDVPSPDGFDRAGAPDDERLRLVGAVAETMAERDYAYLTVDRLAAAAGVDHATFHEHFAGRSEAVAVAHDVVFESLLETLQHACNSELQWPRKVRAAIAAGLAFAVSQPERARLVCLDALSVDAEVASHLLASNDRLAAMLSDGRAHYPQAGELPKLTEITLINGVLALVATHLVGDSASELSALEPQLVEMILLPYVGGEEASRVAADSEA
jgi:AcrR family transcriptional regulator